MPVILQELPTASLPDMLNAARMPAGGDVICGSWWAWPVVGKATEDAAEDDREVRARG